MSSKEKLIYTVSNLTEEESEILYQMIQVFIKRKDTASKTESQLAFEELERYRKSFPKTSESSDYKEEYRKALERKYESLD